MLKKTEEKKKYVPYCPRCKSLDVHPTLMGMIGGSGFKCEKCGYRGFCPEIEVEKVGVLRGKASGMHQKQASERIKEI